MAQAEQTSIVVIDEYPPSREAVLSVVRDIHADYDISEVVQNGDERRRDEIIKALGCDIVLRGDPNVLTALINYTDEDKREIIGEIKKPFSYEELISLLRESINRLGVNLD